MLRIFAPYDILKEQILHESQLINKLKTYTIMDKKVMVTALTASVALMNIGSAATSFSEDFSSNDIGDNFVVTDSVGGSSIDFTGGNATFNGGNNVRSFIGTTDTDFASVSFTASVDVTIQAGSETTGFIGLGPGLIGTDGNSAFGEPSTGPVVYGVLTGDSRNNSDGTFITDTRNAGTTGGNSGLPNDGTIVSVGSHTIFLDYDADAETLTFSADILGAGTVTELDVVDASGVGFADTNSRIFFGGDEGVVFDNFSVTVVPEPTSALLLGVTGILGLVRRRR